MNDVNDDYTIADHEFRDDDVYALGKYRLTQRWLQPLSTRGTLLNIGCGAGQFNAMAVDLGFDVRGFEPDPEAFALATREIFRVFVAKSANSASKAFRASASPT